MMLLPRLCRAFSPQPLPLWTVESVAFAYDPQTASEWRNRGTRIRILEFLISRSDEVDES